MKQPDGSLRALAPGRRSMLLNIASGLGTVIVVFAGVPGVLIWAVGLPRVKLPNPGFGSAHGLVDLLAVVVWIAWLRCCFPLVCSVIRRVKQQDLSSTTRPLPLDRLGIRMASAILILGSTATAAERFSRWSGDQGGIGSAHWANGTGRVALGADSRSVRTVRVIPSGDRRSLPVVPLAVKTGTPRSSSARVNNSSERAGSSRKALNEGLEFRSSQPNSEEVTAVTRSSPLAPRRDGAGLDHRGTDLESSDESWVQDFCAVGLGALGAAAIARRLRRRRAIAVRKGTVKPQTTRR